MKLVNFLSSKKAGLIIVLLIAAAIPLTVIVSQKQQELRQQALILSLARLSVGAQDGDTSTPISGVVISGTQSRISRSVVIETSGTTLYRVESPSPISTTLTAPLNANGKPFERWSGCDSATGQQCTVSVAVGFTKISVAVYKTAVIPTPTQPPPPANPSNLKIATTCNATNSPVVLFKWDKGANTTGYDMDVNGRAWTGTAAPSPWGVAIRNPAALGLFQWQSQLPLDSGDVDPFTSGSQIIPANNTQYWWRVKALGNGGESSYVYYRPGGVGTTTPPGTNFTTPDCAHPIPTPAPSGS